jgi:20S proteasome alpha/beta subunit
MTLIIGARCKDGAVMVSDLLAQRGTENKTVRKLYQPFTNIIVGAAGSRGLSIKMMGEMTAKVASGDVKNTTEYIEKMEDLSFEYARRYVPRGQELELMVSLRDGQYSRVFAICEGVSEPIDDYFAIGHGERHIQIFLKKIWHPDMTMRTFAEFATFLLHYVITFDLDNSVGKGIHICYLPDIKDTNQSEAIKEEFINDTSPFLVSARSRIEKVDELLKGLFEETRKSDATTSA